MKTAYALSTLALAGVLSLSALSVQAAPKVIVISLDGNAQPTLAGYFADGTIPANQGLGILKAKGSYANSNLPITPSITAPSHISIATGASAAANDIFGNSFHLVSSPFTSNVSGFGAPIGGYKLAQPTATPAVPAAHATAPTAEPPTLARAPTAHIHAAREGARSSRVRPVR